MNISVGATNLNAIKAKYPLCSKPKYSYLAVGAAGATDLAGNSMSVLDTIYAGIDVRMYTYDRTSPELDYYVLDMNAGTLKLTFSETVDVSKMDVTQITLQQNALSNVSDSSKSFTITESTTTSTDDDTDITLYLSDDDLNNIKLLYTLCTDKDSCFLRHTSNLVVDMSSYRNEIIEIRDGEGQAALKLIPDTTSPEIEWFNLDMDSRILTIHYSEVVNTSWAHASGVTIQDAATASSSVTLTDDTSTNSRNGLEVIFELSDGDFNNLKRDSMHTVDVATSWLITDTTSMADMMNPPNMIKSIADEFATQVTNFTADFSQPRLVSYELDLDTGNLTLTFSEPVDTTTLDVTGIALYGARDDTDSQITLTTDSYTMSTPDVTIDIALRGVDLYTIKLSDQVATGQWGDDTYLSIEEGAIMDTITYDTASDGTQTVTQNDVKAVTSVKAMGRHNFTQDKTPPEMTAFDIDMDSGFLTLFFNEPMRANSLNITYCTLLRHEEWPTHGHDEHNATTFRDTKYFGPFLDTTNDNFLTFMIGEHDIDHIKTNPYLALDATTSWLKCNAGVANDMAGNPVIVVNGSEVIQVMTYTADTTGPTLEGFDYNMELGNLTMYWDEPIDTETFDVTGITFQSVASAGTTTTITAVADGFTIQAKNCRSMIATLGKTTVQALLAASDLFTAPDDSYVVVSSGVVKDLSFTPNANQAITDGDALVIGPYLEFFKLDMDAGTMQLHFTEGVDESTFDDSQITLQMAESDASESYSFAGGGSVTAPAAGEAEYLELALSLDDVDELKMLTYVAHSKSYVYIALNPEVVYDDESNIGPNPAIEVSVDDARLADDFTADTTRPMLAHWSLDMNSGTLSLTFDEPVRSSTFDGTKLTIQSDQVYNNDTEYVTLTANSTTASSDGRTIDIDILQAQGDGMDLDSIKVYRSLAMSDSESWLWFSRYMAHDCATTVNRVWPVYSDNATAVSSYTADGEGPTLMWFDLDLDSGLLTLTFDEAVDDSVFDASQISFQAESSGGSSIALTTESQLLTVKPGAVMEVEINTAKLHEIFLEDDLCTNDASTYIVMTASVTTDMAGRTCSNSSVCDYDDSESNSFDEIDTSSALAVQTYTYDTTSPSLNAFSLDMDMGKLTLHFDEPVNVATLKSNEITIQYAKYTGSSIEKHTIRNTNTTASSNGYKVELLLSVSDLNELKSKQGTAISRASTYIVMGKTAIYDMAGNLLSAVTDGNALQVTNFTQDTTRPTIESFKLYDNGVVQLKFSETIDYSSANLSAIVFQDNAPPSSGAGSYALTEASLVTTTSFASEVLIDIADDYSMMTGYGIGSDQATSYLRLFAGAFLDMVGNRLFGMSSADALQMGPVLESFNLDMNTGTMQLYFSESVKGSENKTFNPGALKFQTVNGKQGHVLTADTYTTTFFGSTLSVVLSDSDMDAIKLKADLAVDSSSAYLYVIDDANARLSYNTDTETVGAPNYVTTTSNSTEQGMLAVSIYTADTTSPELIEYLIDKDAQILVLNFSEPVDAERFNVSHVTLQASAELQSGDSYYTLKEDNSIVNTGNGESVRINIGNQDWVEIVSSSVGSYLVVGSKACTDLASPSNEMAAVEDGSAMQVSKIIYDRTPPTLNSWSLDLEEGYIYMSFDEPVNPDTLNITKFTLTPARETLNGSYTLTADTFTLSEAGLDVTLDMALITTDLDAIKVNGKLAVSKQTSYLVWREGAISDMADFANEIDTLNLYPYGLQVDSYTADSSDPSLNSFDFSITTGILELHYSEAMESSSLDGYSLRMQSTADGSGDYVDLGGGTTLGKDGTTLYYTLSSTTLQAISSSGTAVATSQMTTYLAAGKGHAQDMAGNNVTAVGKSDAMLLGPSLLRFTLDMDSGVLRLFFPEMVDLSSFNLTSIALVDDDNWRGGISAYTLVNNNKTEAVLTHDDTILTVTMAQSDANAIKMVYGLCTTEERAKLSIDKYLVKDTAPSANYVRQVTIADAISPTIFTADTTSPSYQSFSLDMDTGYMTLVFDEPVIGDDIDVSRITIQSNISNVWDYSTYTLTSGTGSSTVTSGYRGVSREQKIQIGYDDLSAIKIMTGLATKAETTFFVGKTATFFDTSAAANSAKSVSTASAMSVQTYVPDTTAPVLQSYDLDMDSGELKLYFSEPIDTETFHAEQLVIQNDVTSDGKNFHALTNSSYTVSADGDEMLLYLSTDDHFAVNAIFDLAQSETDTYMTAATYTVRDMAGNRLYAIPDGQALPVSTYTPDTTSPNLEQFTLDMDTGVVVMDFDETMLYTSFAAGMLTFQETEVYDSEDVNYEMYALTTDTTADFSGNSSTQWTFVLCKDDIDSLKYYQSLAVDQNSTNLVVKGTFATDMSGNKINTIPSSSAKASAKYSADTTDPEIVSFDLDMNTGTLSMTFTESMKAQLSDHSLITLNEQPKSATGYSLTLTGGEFSGYVEKLSPTIDLVLLEDDLNNLKGMAIGSLKNYTWMTLKTGAFSDRSLLLTPRVLSYDVYGGSALQVSTLTPDVGPPSLERFTIEPNEKKVYFFFDEAVKISSWDPAAVTFQNIEYFQPGLDNTSAVITLTTSTAAYGRDYTEVIVDLAPDCPEDEDAKGGCDWNRLRTGIDVEGGTETVYIIMASNAISDNADPPNYVVAIENSERRRLSESALVQASPYCGPCEAGSYQSEECTSVYDQVCANCTSCGEGFYETNECTPEFNTECTECTVCEYGTFTNVACGGTDDTVCGTCTVCGDMEYELVECSAGSNTECSTCAVCEWSNDAHELGCEGSPVWWRLKNCWFDKDGNKVQRNLVDLEDLRIDTRQGRRHWVWDVAIPEVYGYAQGDWTAD